MLGKYLLKLRGLLFKDITSKKKSTSKRQLNILKLDGTAESISDVLLCLEKKIKLHNSF